MLGSQRAVPTIAVKDINVARDFYEKKLGLSPVGPKDDYVQHYQCGDGTIEVYKSDFAGTNQSTSMTFEVNDIQEEVKNLSRKGVEFEHYQMPDVKVEGDIHVMEDMKVAWFKDPDGNIICIHQ